MSTVHVDGSMPSVLDSQLESPVPAVAAPSPVAAATTSSLSTSTPPHPIENATITSVSGTEKGVDIPTPSKFIALYSRPEVFLTDLPVSGELETTVLKVGEIKRRFLTFADQLKAGAAEIVTHNSWDARRIESIDEAIAITDLFDWVKASQTAGVPHEFNEKTYKQIMAAERVYRAHFSKPSFIMKARLATAEKESACLTRSQSENLVCSKPRCPCRLSTTKCTTVSRRPTNGSRQNAKSASKRSETTPTVTRYAGRSQISWKGTGLTRMMPAELYRSHARMCVASTTRASSGASIAGQSKRSKKKEGCRQEPNAHEQARHDGKLRIGVEFPRPVDIDCSRVGEFRSSPPRTEPSSTDPDTSPSGAAVRRDRRVPDGRVAVVPR